RREETLARLDAIRNAIAGWDDVALQAADAELAACINHKGARDNRSRGLRELRAWARTGIAPELLSATARKAADDLAERTLSTMKSCRRLPQGPLFAAVADLDAGIRALESLDHASRARLLLDARAYLERELPARMKSLGVVGHDQAVDELAAALDDPWRGALAVRAIRTRWPLALVGEPKQAIYGFRGGDVHAWLMAKHDAQGEPLRLDESQRAGSGVSAAINALFTRDGAFVEEGIAHEDVHSARRVEQRALLVDGEPTPGLQIWRLPPPEPRGKTKPNSTTRAMRDPG